MCGLGRGGIDVAGVVVVGGGGGDGGGDVVVSSVLLSTPYLAIT